MELVLATLHISNEVSGLGHGSQDNFESCPWFLLFFQQLLILERRRQEILHRIGKFETEDPLASYLCLFSSFELEKTLQFPLFEKLFIF